MTAEDFGSSMVDPAAATGEPPADGMAADPDEGRAAGEGTSGETSGEALEHVPALRLRPRRLRLGDLGLMCAARACHETLGPLVAAVEDVSLQGMGLVVPGAADGAWLVSGGDPLSGLAVYCGGEPIYQGTATVRHAEPQGGDLLVGMELDSRFVDLDVLDRHRRRRGFNERWRAFREQESPGPAAEGFIEWILDVHGFLERARTFLDGEEAALGSEDLPTREQAMQQYLDAAAPFVVARLSQARAELADLVRDVPENQLAEWRAFCRAHLGPLLACSPLMRRAAEKPLGYPGDYEVMNMLYRGQAEGSSLFAKTLSLYWSQEAAARANVNRIEYLVGRIRAVLASTREGRARVASIGCGPAREIAVVLERWPDLGPRLDLTLVDQEERAVRYCERTLAPVAAATGARVRFIQASIRSLLLARGLGTALGERDLIYSAGLFDYLDHRCSVALLRGLYQALAPGGTMAIGNVAADNPSRAAMEFFCDWFLVHRTAEEMRALARGLRPAPLAIDVEAEPLGVNLFLVVSR
jgi:extracellular factor (EF) 3-hydroxypalmitic acid methyl ester biosynthesis protein